MRTRREATRLCRTAQARQNLPQASVVFWFPTRVERSRPTIPVGSRLFPILGNRYQVAYTCERVNPKDKAYQKGYTAFRERLIRARKDAGLTQGEVNRRMGKPHSFISKCELGERRVDFVELQLLARIYEKNLTFFVTLD